jgi:recombinational DNA repair protein (RecF pathway)
MALRQAFELKVLQATGFGLDFGRCRLCGSDSETHNGWNYFVPARGGVVCAQCRSQVPENGIRLSVADTAATARLGAVGLEQAAILPSPGADSALAVARFLATILDRKLRSLDFLNSIL